MDRKSVEVFIPDREACLYCESENVIKKETTGKDTQKYRCKECDSWFNDLTGTLFEFHKFPIEEMFYMLKEMRSVRSAQIASDLERDPEAILNFVHEVHDLCGEIDNFTLSDVVEANEIYITAGEKGDEGKDGTNVASQKGARRLPRRQTTGHETRLRELSERG
jgi:transposase-like protein